MFSPDPCHTTFVHHQNIMETVIAQSDEFTIVDDSSGFVYVMDGEESVRLTIPLDILLDLATQLTNP